MAAHTVEQIREAKRILEQELNKAISERLRMFKEVTHMDVEEIEARFVTRQNVGSLYPTPIFQGVKVKLESI